ncbi:hypothetical protein [Candidatus Macondimonas diazotrophica]|jgi:hypothetical protein|uniref:Uncharacterized protein n=1 Tax=Candidatus Macondimonas diazotrophica TaxID=2305248 RepID=A0A4Z0F620_9GAMM|nr:hypothetical protein [Candidatus Macondimonas diazotrophica]TFZ81678.1 hypothetical protein E4680_11450 [Candidatus Macondimonas diazotrophica]
MTARCYIILPKYIDFKDLLEVPDVSYEVKTLKEAIDYRANLFPPEIYNIWDIETAQLVLGIHPVTGNVVVPPEKGALQ